MIYVLCYDDSSENMAIASFSGFPWARVYRLPEERQNHLQEGIAYTTELIALYDEWKDADFVGTVSYCFFDKIPYSHFINLINGITSTTDAVFFYTGTDPNVGNCNLILKELLDDICNRLFNTNSGLLNGLKSKRINKITRYSFSNFFVVRPNLMFDYIHWVSNTVIPMLEKHPNVWCDSGYYNNKINGERLLKLTKNRVSYFPCHVFIVERLPYSYFLSKNLKILF